MPKAKAVKANDFISAERAARYQYRLGTHVASSLSGFIAGALVATIIWLAVAYIIKFFG